MAVGFEPTSAKHNTLAVYPINHSGKPSKCGAENRTQVYTVTTYCTHHYPTSTL